MMTDTPVCRWDPRIPVPDFAKDRGGRGAKMTGIQDLGGKREGGVYEWY
jgi:hypothetical protein